MPARLKAAAMHELCRRAGRRLPRHSAFQVRHGIAAAAEHIAKLQPAVWRRPVFADGRLDDA